MTEDGADPVGSSQGDSRKVVDPDSVESSPEDVVMPDASDPNNQPLGSTAGSTVESTRPAAEHSGDQETARDDGMNGQSVEKSDGSPQASDSSVTETSIPVQASLYYLTNRMNLNGILSSRLIAPRESFQKYYADLLQVTPGWVPLLQDAPRAGQIEAVVSERGSGSPVIIEFPSTILGKTKPRSRVAYLPAVALSEARAIHFASERDLREHRARGYSNVHPHDDLLRVTPELFESTHRDDVTLEAPRPALAVAWRSIDRIRGAINGAVASVTSGEQLVLAAALLGAVKLPTDVSFPSWFGWSELDDHDSLENRAKPEIAQPDHVTFRAVYDVLGQQDVSEAWSPNDVLDSIEGLVRAAGLTDDAADAVIRNLNRVRAIVNVEVDFEPFRQSARALISAKALLLVLMRQELEQLLEWSDAETGADDATRVAAALLAGRLRGLSRESTALRSRELDDLTAAWAVRVAHGRDASLGKIQVLANSRATTLKIAGVNIVTRGPLLPDLPAKYRKLPEDKKAATRLRVSRALGWPVEHRLPLPPGASVHTSDDWVVVASPHEIVLDVVVEEGAFIQRLETLTSSERRQASEAFAARR